jgi:hypothetical protein
MILKKHKTDFKKSLLLNHASELETISINPSQLYSDNAELSWLDKNKEVMFRGEMYDIACIKSTGTGLILYVIPDKKEKELFNEFKKQFGFLNDDAGKKKSGHMISKLLTLEYTFTSFSFSAIQPLSHFDFQTYSNEPAAGFGSLSSPPPDRS